MIEIKNLVKSYGDKKILNGINLYADEGKIIGLLGRNGSGKSTLLSILSGASMADSGTIILNKKEVKDRDEISKQVAFVPQDNPLIEDLSVRDNLRLWYAGDKEKLLNSIKNGLINEFGIDKFIDEKVKNLSGGMKKRLSIACALSNDSKILLMDEPGASLDIPLKQEVRDYLVKYKEQMGSVLISSHEAEDFDICDEIYILKNGILTRSPNRDIQSIKSIL